MKRKLAMLLMAACVTVTSVPVTVFATETSVAITEENFPDDAFRALVEKRDDNEDGTLTVNELEIYGDASEWEISNAEVSSLKGLELINQIYPVTYLSCQNAGLTELDVAGFDELVYLYCNNNQLTQIKGLDELSNLKTLYCYGNQLTGVLDVSKLINLVELNCSENQLTGVKLSDSASYLNNGLDFRYNNIESEDAIENWNKTEVGGYFLPQKNEAIALIEENFPDEVFREVVADIYDLDKDGQITTKEIYQSGEGYWDFSNQGINDLTGFELLNSVMQYESLDCSGNNLKYLDVSGLTGITYINCSNNLLTDILDLSALDDLASLDCSKNMLTGVKLSKNIQPEYEGLNFRYNQMTDKSAVENWNEEKYSGYFWPQGEQDFVDISETNFPDANFRAYITKLYDVDLDGYLNPHEIENATELDECESGDIADFTGIEYLKNLKYVELADETVKNLSKLPDSVQEFYCAGCELTKLPELSTDLKYLNCSGNSLTALPELPSGLVELGCSFNEISGVLDLSSFHNLTSVTCSNNNITGIKLSAKATYESIRCQMNHMDSVSDITGRSDITWDTGDFVYTRQKTACERGGHNYKTVKVTTKATFTKAGKQNVKCSVCGETATIAIPKVSSVKLSYTDNKTVYSGIKKTPGVTVKDTDGNKLTKGTDYTVTYSSSTRKSIGRYYVTIKLKGTYYDTVSKKVYFYIVPKSPSKVTASLTAYNTVSVKWNKSTGAKGYIIYYKTSTAKSYKSVSTTKTFVTLKNLTAGAKYQIKVVPYIKPASSKITSTASKSTTIYTLKKLNKPTITKSSSTKVKVQWNNIDGETGYQISKSAKKSGTSIVATVKSTSAKSTTVAAKKNVTYYYKVRVYKVSNGKKIYGPWSTAVAYKLK